LIFNYKVTK